MKRADDPGKYFNLSTALNVLNELLAGRPKEEKRKRIKESKRDLHRELKAEIKRRKQIQKEKEKFEKAYNQRQKEIIRRAKQHARKILREYKQQEKYEYNETKRIITELERENKRLKQQAKQQDQLFNQEVRRFRKLQLEQERQNKREEKEYQKQQRRKEREIRRALNKSSWTKTVDRRARKQLLQWQREMEDENQVELEYTTNVFNRHRIKNLFSRTIEAFIIINRQKVLEILVVNNKVVYTLKITMAKQIQDENGQPIEKTDKQYISKSAFTLLDENDKVESYDSLIEYFNSKLVDLELKESGWYLKSIDYLDIKLSKYEPLRGGCYHDKLPKDLHKSRSILQLENKEDNQCLKWAITYQSLEEKPKDNKGRINQKLREHSKTLDFKGMEFPSCQKDLQKFEKQNPYLVYCYGLDDKGKYFIYYKNKNFHDLSRKRQVLNILWFKDHFYPIENLRAFHKYIFRTNKCHYVCQSCLNHYDTQEKLDEHYTYCQHEFPTRTSYPKPNSYLKFQKHQATFKHPFAAYFDTESTLQPINENHGNTKRYQKHNPSMFGLLLVNNIKGTSEYSQHNTSDQLIEKLENFVHTDIETSFVPLAGDELEKAKRAKKSRKCCDHCKDKFTHEDYAVLHHDHYNGKWLGVLHNSCNLKLKQRPFLPVFAHNLSRYDEKAIIRSIEGKSTIIAKNIENFISFDYLVPGTKSTKIKFLDSYKFLSSSLAKLTENLLDKGSENFKFTKEAFDEHFDLCLRKGVYPYDYVENDEILNETSLPSKDAFYSKLSQEHISEQDYQHAQDVWDKFKCKSLRDYTEIYLKLDVHLLADIIEQFRNFIFDEYSLDPVYYLTLSSLANDCALKFSGVKLELIHDPTMYNFLESGIRGGVSMICKRYAEANNKYMEDYDPTKPSKFITYNDANNLYGTPMLGDLPVKNFRWSKDLNWENHGDCIVDVDIHLPKELHEKFKDYPLCPTHENGKLMTTLYDKEHYVCHSRYLKEVISHGYQVTKVHKVLLFDSSPWLRDYVLKNTKLRSNAKSNFEKDLWKLMNNAVYGKQIENVRKRVNIKLVNDDESYTKLVAKPNYKDTMILQRGETTQYLVEMSRTSVTLNKPIYGGQAILDLSKIVMSNFYYNFIKPKFGDNYELLMTDTDSFMGLVHSEDYYNDIKDDIDQWFDTSGFPKDFGCEGFPIGLNKKVPGKFKDEMSGKPITGFTGLRPKQYAFKTENSTTLKCKGINKQGMRNVGYEDYVKALDPKTESIYTNMNIIRSHKHQNYTETIHKKVLDPHDTKRIILENGIDTVPFGYSLHS